jgi:hypothetical protein
VENVHFHAQYWGQLAIGSEDRSYAFDWVQNAMRDNLTAFKFGWTDWEYVTDTFVWCANIGYHFVDSVPEYGTERCSMNGQLKGVAFDSVRTGFKVERIQSMGLVVSNGQFNANGGKPFTSIDITEDCDGNIRFDNCNFWGNTKKPVLSNGFGFLSLSNCYIENLNQENINEPLIEINHGRAQINCCSFLTRKNRTHIQINARTLHAVITSNNACDLAPAVTSGVKD